MTLNISTATGTVYRLQRVFPSDSWSFLLYDILIKVKI